MIIKRIKEKGILAKLLEKGIKILLYKECKKIGKIKIDIIASSIEIIRGVIEKIYINAEEVNYKELLIDKIELESDEVKIAFKINNNDFNFKNNFTIKFKISLSENSIKKILLSSIWDWIWDIISNELLNQAKLEDIKIKNNLIFVKSIKQNSSNFELEKLELKAEIGKIYVSNENHAKSIVIPIEDKVYIKSLNVNNNSIIIEGNSSISF